MTLEKRGGIPAEIRSDADGLKVEGYAAVFGEETDIGGMFREVIERGAFADAIGRDDVVFLINHDGLPLARTRSGTLKLTEDDHGLKIGDLDKMSFAFFPEIQEWDEEGETPLRTIKKASLHDVSIVTSPAYEGTEIALRSLAASRPSESAQEFRLRNKRKLIN